MQHGQLITMISQEILPDDEDLMASLVTCIESHPNHKGNGSCPIQTRRLCIQKKKIFEPKIC